jgi:lipopolysaccharide assembly protein A
MKMQWMILFGLLFAIVIAAFAVMNVDNVPVNYIFGEAQWPLILVILGSTLVGAIISACFAGVKMFSGSRANATLQKKVDAQQHIIVQKDTDIIQLKEQLDAKQILLDAQQRDIVRLESEINANSMLNKTDVASDHDYFL